MNIDDNLVYFTIISFILIIVLYTNMQLSVDNSYTKALHGYWFLDDEFIIQSKLKAGGLIITEDSLLINLDADENTITAKLCKGEFSISNCTMTGCSNIKKYTLKVSGGEGNFFDSDEMKTMRIEIEDNILRMYCGDVLYLKAIKHDKLSKVFTE
jgi:hypothetical protein